MGVSLVDRIFPLNRAALGWLTGAQVKTVVTSGEYEVFSDRDNHTSQPDKPLILQVLVQYEGHADFIYLTVPNTQDVRDSEVITPENYNRGIEVSAGQGGDSYLRSGDGRVSSVGYQAFNPYNNIEDFPSINPLLLLGDEMHLIWEGTDVRIKMLERSEGRAKVSVIFGGQEPGVSPVSTCGRRDVNGDGVINIIDLVSIARRFGNYSAGLAEDVNEDGRINIIDLVLVAQQFGRECQPTTGTPVTKQSLRRFASVLKSIFWAIGD